MQQRYMVKVGSSIRFYFEGDFAQASAPITIEGAPTPFQTAHARHYPTVAAGILAAYLSNDGWDCIGEDEEAWVYAEDGDLIGPVV